MGDEWGPDGELPDGPGKVDPRPTPSNTHSSGGPGDGFDDSNSSWDNMEGTTIEAPLLPSLYDILPYIPLLLPFIGPLLPKPASPKKTAPDTPESKPDPEPGSPEPKDPGPKPTPGEPSPVTPIPDPVPQPTPKPVPDPVTGNPPERCWVAREVYGYNNPSWLLFRDYLDFSSPRWFKKFYISHGEKIAEFIKDKPFLKKLIKALMDTKI